LARWPWFWLRAPWIVSIEIGDRASHKPDESSHGQTTSVLLGDTTTGQPESGRRHSRAVNLGSTCGRLARSLRLPGRMRRQSRIGPARRQHDNRCRFDATERIARQPRALPDPRQRGDRLRSPAPAGVLQDRRRLCRKRTKPGRRAATDARRLPAGARREHWGRERHLLRVAIRDGVRRRTRAVLRIPSRLRRPGRSAIPLLRVRRPRRRWLWRTPSRRAGRRECSIQRGPVPAARGRYVRAAPEVLRGGGDLRRPGDLRADRRRSRAVLWLNASARHFYTRGDGRLASPRSVDRCRDFRGLARIG